MCYDKVLSAVSAVMFAGRLSDSHLKRGDLQYVGWPVSQPPHIQEIYKFLHGP